MANYTDEDLLSLEKRNEHYTCGCEAEPMLWEIPKLIADLREERAVLRAAEEWVKALGRSTEVWCSSEEAVQFVAGADFETVVDARAMHATTLALRAAVDALTRAGKEEG